MTDVHNNGEQTLRCHVVCGRGNGRETEGPSRGSGGTAISANASA